MTVEQYLETLPPRTGIRIIGTEKDSSLDFPEDDPLIMQYNKMDDYLSSLTKCYEFVAATNAYNMGGVDVTIYTGEVIYGEEENTGL